MRIFSKRRSDPPLLLPGRSRSAVTCFLGQHFYALHRECHNLPPIAHLLIHEPLPLAETHKMHGRHSLDCSHYIHVSGSYTTTVHPIPL